MAAARLDDPFTCGQCDGFDTRIVRTGCRVFCFFDSDGSGELTREDIKAAFEKAKDEVAGGVTRAKFVDVIVEEVQYCESEADKSFERVRTVSGAENENLLTEKDVDTFVDRVFGVVGESVSKPFFMLIHSVTYPEIEDKNCRTGK